MDSLINIELNLVVCKVDRSLLELRYSLMLLPSPMKFSPLPNLVLRPKLDLDRLGAEDDIEFAFDVLLLL